MYLYGHVGFTLFIYYLLRSRSESAKITSYGILAIGAMLPDLIDKPIGSMFFETGRWIGHSLVFVTSFYLSLSIAVRRYDHPILTSDYANLFGMGSLAHLIFDYPGITRDVVLWPVFGGFESGNREDFLRGIESPRTILFELLGLTLLIVIGKKENLGERYWRGLILLSILYVVAVGTLYIFLITI